MSKSMEAMKVEWALKAAIETISMQHGMDARITNSRDEGAKLGFWVEFEVADKNAREEIQRKEFVFDCRASVTRGMLKPEDYGAVLLVKGKRYKLVGVNRDAPSYPLRTEALDGGPDYRLSLATLSNRL